MRIPSLPVSILLAAALSLTACGGMPAAPATAPSPAVDSAIDLRADYRALARASGQVYALDPAQSKVRIYVFRGGRAAKAGHNHVLDAPQFEGYVHLPSDDVAQARFDLRFRLDQLRVDEPTLRAETGGAFAGERSASDIEGTRRNMLGARGLDAERFPVVGLRSVTISGDWPMLAAEVEVTLHGVSRRQLVPLVVSRTEARLAVSGSLALRQTDFGAEPYSLLGGLLAVQDAVAIRFELVAEPARLD